LAIDDWEEALSDQLSAFSFGREQVDVLFLADS
jgi:hypothetical protein